MMFIPVTKVYSCDFDSYIVKYKDCDDIQLISKYEKKQLESEGITMYGTQKNEREIEYIEPNYDVELFGDSWSTKLVNAETAWNYGCYGNEVKVAVIDSGLCANAFNTEIIEGFNFVDNSNNISDNIGHGTFVSSIICETKKGDDAEGVAPKVKLIPIKCFENGYSTKADVIAKAINYAVNDCKCDIINMSFGFSGNSSYLKEVVNNALENGVILVAAVGNNGNSNMKYPAGYEGVIGVGAVDKNRAICSFSQHNNSVDVTAPGIDILGYCIDGYSSNSGTSFSAPYVTAAAAVAKCIFPNITPAEFESLIKKTVCDLGEEGYDIYYGYGLLDIDKLFFELMNKYDVFMSPVTVKNGFASAIVLNNEENDILGKEIISVYDEKCLVSCKIKDIKVNVGKNTIFFSVSDTAHIKIFLWNGRENLKPITLSREYNY